MKYIALVDSNFKDLIKNKAIESVIDIDLNNYIQPASIDIPVSNVAYLVKYKFLPFKQKVSNVVDTLKLEELNLDDNPILFKDQTYLIPCLKFNNIDKKYVVKVSPKSSIGRIDVMVRAVNDYSAYYDYIEKVDNILWLEVTPQSFNIRLKSGIALSQLMILEKTKERVDIKNEELIFDSKNVLIKNKVYTKNELILNVEIPNNDIVGYVARNTNEVIDLSQKNYDKNVFFKEINLAKESNQIILEQDKFYILRTKHFLQIPPKYSAEMIALNNMFGEFRVHYAGFFDPGFGYKKGGNQGVLEIRPYETLIIYDNQPICSMKFYENKKIPDKIYGELKNNYSEQKSIKLSKYFR